MKQKLEMSFLYLGGWAKGHARSMSLSATFPKGARALQQICGGVSVLGGATRVLQVDLGL